MIVGYLGTIFLILAYIIINTKHKNYFLYINFLATSLFLWHAVLIRDIPFSITNGFIILMIIINLWRKK